MAQTPVRVNKNSLSISSSPRRRRSWRFIRSSHLSPTSQTRCGHVLPSEPDSRVFSRDQKIVTTFAEPHLQMFWHAHPVPHPNRTGKLDISRTSLLPPLFSRYFSKLKEPFDALHCNILDSSLSLHSFNQTFLNKKGNLNSNN
jgi:hypothetical protein